MPLSPSSTSGHLTIVKNKLVVPQGPGTPLEVDPGTPGGSAPLYTPDHTWAGLAGSTGFAADRDEILTDVLAAGAPLKVFRIGFNWATIEPNQTDGPTFWGSVDPIVQWCLDNGVEPLLQGPSYSAPAWTGGQTKWPGNITWDQYKTKYSAACAAMVNRYHKDGSAKASFINDTSYVKFYEIGNEHNNTIFVQSTDNAHGYGMGNPDPIYCAELQAVAYDRIKDEVGPDALVSWGGFAVGSAARLGGYMHELNWMILLLDTWEALGYTKHADGWAAIPADFGCMHPYGGDRPGSPTSTVAKVPFTVRSNGDWNVMCNKIPLVHNELHRRGFGSLRIWGTESGHPNNMGAVTGFGFGHDRTSPAQTAQEWTLHSMQESYDYNRQQYRVWSGLDTWPTGSALTPFQAPGSPQDHLGPLFYFGLRDHDAEPYTTPTTIEQNYGLYKKLAPWSGPGSWARKQVTGGSNDVFDAFMTWKQP